MMMDLQTALVCVGFVVVSAAILLFISMVVTKEKSYEEAIAEQRQQSSMLLGTQNKSKVKDKKQKKAGKKVKEKVQFVEADTAEDSENAEMTPSETIAASLPAATNIQKHHVEFKEPQVSEEPVKEVTKRRSKKDKVRPILLNRDMSEEKIGSVDDVPSANNFEQLHPKDDFELMHSHLIHKEEAVVEKEQPPAKEKPAKQKQQNTENEAATTTTTSTNKSNKKAVKHQTNEIIAQNIPVEKEEIVEAVAVVQQTQTNGVISGATTNGKDKKKKKSEQNTLQQLASDKQGISLQVLTSLVRKAEMSRSEVQILIDMLLNKQHEAPAVIDEWSEGKTDPVQKLKKQLAEKEKLLIEEQEALVGAQAKLKEVRAEQIAERSQLQQRARALEEALNAKQLEMQATNNRVHGLNQKLQGVQGQINDEVMKNRQLIEDNNAMQMHRQQLEIRLTQAEEVKETIQNDMRSITEQFENQKTVIVHQQYELTQKDELIKQVEEARLEMERHMNMQILQDNEIKVEISQLKTTCQKHLEEIRRLELSKSQSLSELKAQQDEYEKKITQLNQELQRIKDEKQKLENSRENEAVEEKKVQVKIKNIQNELSSNFATIERLQSELEAQKEKNNAEITSVKREEQLTHRKMVQRLFPNIKFDDNMSQDKWISNVESAIRNYVSNLEKPKTPEPVDNGEIVKLQLQLQKNKQSLDDYDNLLNELQTRTAQTEMEWRKEIEKKNIELEDKNSTIRKQLDKIDKIEGEMTALAEMVTQLRTQLDEMAAAVEMEKQVNDRLTNENTILKSEAATSSSELAIDVEKLQSQVEQMSQQLFEEQRKNKELQTQIENNLVSKTINHNNTSNGPSITVENNGSQ